MSNDDLGDYLEAAARDLPLEQFIITMRRKLSEPAPRAELLSQEQRAVLDDCASLPVGTLEFLRKEGSIPLSNLAVSELARRAARKESKL